MNPTFESIDDLPQALYARWEKWSDGLCTSSCGNDYDCPHEEDFLEIANKEAEVVLEAKKLTQHND